MQVNQCTCIQIMILPVSFSLLFFFSNVQLNKHIKIS